MPIVDIVQRSEKWHVWRSQGITASMIPVIMGLSPYKTPYELWAELVGFKKPDDLSNNYHVQRGVEQEPEARDAVEEHYGKPYMPVCVEADHNSLFRASLDGLYKLGDDKEVLEIKCPCEKIYNEILQLQGNAPTFRMYAAQVQWQLNTAGATAGRLYFYLRGKRPISTPIRRSDAFIAKAEHAAVHFWNLVQTKTPPEMIEGRDKVVYDTPLSNTDNAWLAKVNQYKEKSAYLEELKAKMNAVKADLKGLEAYFTEQIPDNVKTFDKDGIRATRVDKTGSVDFEAVAYDLANNVNVEIPQSMIEKHRKADSSYYRITVKDTPQDKGVAIEQYTPELNKGEPLQAVMTVTPAEVAIPEELKPEVVQEPVQPEPKEIVDPTPIQPLAPANFFEKSSSPMYF